MSAVGSFRFCPFPVIRTAYLGSLSAAVPGRRCSRLAGACRVSHHGREQTAATAPRGAAKDELSLYQPVNPLQLLDCLQLQASPLLPRKRPLALNHPQTPYGGVVTGAPSITTPRSCPRGPAFIAAVSSNLKLSVS
jgi:hypothetical protein